MQNYVRYGREYIKTKNFSADCAIYNNRCGFAHETTLRGFGYCIYKKICYYNRTWERWQFESVIMEAIEKLPKKLQAEAQTEFEAYWKHESEKLDAQFEAFQAAYNNLTDKQKKALESVTVTDKAGFDAVCAVTQVMSLVNK